MKIKFKKLLQTVNWNKVLIVGVVAFIVATINILHVIIGFAKTPPGMMYMWTGHYYLDYFQYVQAIAQGMQGKWLLENPLTLEDNSKTFVGMWQNLFFGKIGGLFHLSPITTYWLTVFILTLILCFLIFKLIRQLLKGESFIKQIVAYVLTLFAAPFFQIIKNGSTFSILRFDFWSDKSVLWKRFGSIPYHLSADIIVIVILLLIGNIWERLDKLSFRSLLIKTILISFLTIFLLTFSPSSALLIGCAIGLSSLFIFIKSVLRREKKQLGRIVIFSLIFLSLFVAAGLLIRSYLLTTYYSIAFGFEKAWQEKPKIAQFVLTHGPLFLLAFLGIVTYIRHLTKIRLVFLSFVIGSYTLFFSPLALLLSTTNTRFLSSLSYVLFAVLAVLWIKKTRYLLILGLFVLFFSLPSNIVSFQTIINDKNIDSPISYLPIGVVDAFKYIDKVPERGNVLTTPSQFLGCVVTIFTTRKTYVGRHNITINYLDKNITSSNFYLGAMTNEQAEEFLQKNGIRLVMWTSIEGYELKALYRYPFLKEVYKNKDSVIFKVNNS